MLPAPIISTETLSSCADATQTDAPRTIDANRDRFIIHQVIPAPLARTPRTPFQSRRQRWRSRSGSLRAHAPACLRLRAGHRLLDCRQRGIRLGAIWPAGLRHVGTAAAALAAEDLGALAHQLDRIEPRGEIGGNA